jgi:hypothetical protein
MVQMVVASKKKNDDQSVEKSKNRSLHKGVNELMSHVFLHAAKYQTVLAAVLMNHPYATNAITGQKSYNISAIHKQRNKRAHHHPHT